MANSVVAKTPHGPSQRPAGLAAALTIAGSDSCGGAGIQADLKTFTRRGVFGANAVTAITAQNTLAVRAVEVLAADLVAAQIEAVFEDLPVGAIKTGMLANAEIIDAVVEALAGALDRQGPGRVPLVIDPVMIATSGARLLDEAAVGALITRLLPRADLVTPNLPEAAALTGLADNSPAEDLARAILETGCGAVLVKGGHARGEKCIDLLVTPGGVTRFERERVAGRFHGTGCCLSAAITAELARGRRLAEAVEIAGDWLQQLIRNAHRPLAGELGLLPLERGEGGDYPQMNTDNNNQDY